jgi:hypothetical protein
LRATFIGAENFATAQNLKIPGISYDGRYPAIHGGRHERHVPSWPPCQPTPTRCPFFHSETPASSSSVEAVDQCRSPCASLHRAALHNPCHSLTRRSSRPGGRAGPSDISDSLLAPVPLQRLLGQERHGNDQRMHKLLLGNGSAKVVAVKYPEEAGGYTPGDSRKLYVAKASASSNSSSTAAGPRSRACHRNVGRVQKGSSSDDLNGARRHRQLASPPYLPF